MPNIPIPQQVPIERAGWNTDFSGHAQMPDNNNTPVNPILSGLSQAQTQAQTALSGAQTANQVTEVRQKQNDMQASMLAGLAKLPPDQYESAKQHVIPLINQVNPSRQFDTNLDQQTAGLVASGGVSASEQATLANNLQRAQLMMNMKAQHIEKDPLTGQNVVINSITGEQRPVTPQENEYYNATGGMMGDQPGQEAQGGNGMLFAPPPAQPQRQPQAAPQPQQPAPPPAFGFGAGDINPLENKKNLGLTQQWQQADQANRPLFQNMQDKISAMRDTIPKIGASGSTLAKIGLAEGGLTGSDESQAASLLDSQANDLAMMATQLQGAKTGNRGSVLQLKTALASKPNSSQYPQNNQKLLDEMEGKVARADADSSLYNSYIETNPLHTLDNNAYKLADALDRKFPILDKTGKLNSDNLAQWKAAIPDAIQNPKQYLNQTAAQQANSALPKTPQNNQQFKTVEDVGAALQAGKISPAAAQGYWSSMGIK